MGFKIAQRQQVANNSNGSQHNNEDLQHYKILREAVITLRLGALVVHFSTASDASDTCYRLENSIQHHPHFSAIEKTRLQRYLLRRLRELENIHAVKIELMSLALPKKRRVRYILLSIVFANNKTVAKQQYIEKLYLALGLNKLILQDDIKDFSESINNKISIPAKQNKLKLQALETLDIPQAKNTLSAVFSEDENTASAQKTLPSSEMVTATYGHQSLTVKRQNLYNRLILKEKWSNKEFKHLCKHYKLIPKGAIEIVNNWAYQQTATSLLYKKNNAIFVNPDTVTKLQQKIAIA